MDRSILLPHRQSYTREGSKKFNHFGVHSYCTQCLLAYEEEVFKVNLELSEGLLWLGDEPSKVGGQACDLRQRAQE